MQARTVLLLLAVGTVGYLIARRYDTPEAEGSPYKPVIEKVLHQHQGEDTPMLHAFEAALEAEKQHAASAHA